MSCFHHLDLSRWTSLFWPLRTFCIAEGRVGLSFRLSVWTNSRSVLPTRCFPGRRQCLLKIECFVLPWHCKGKRLNSAVVSFSVTFTDERQGFSCVWQRAFARDEYFGKPTYPFCGVSEKRLFVGESVNFLGFCFAKWIEFSLFALEKILRFIGIFQKSKKL